MRRSNPDRKDKSTMTSANRIIIDTRDVLLAMLRIKPTLYATIPTTIILGMLLFPIMTAVLSAAALCVFAWEIQSNPHAQRRLAEDRECRGRLGG
jgi:hypothetical protein